MDVKFELQIDRSDHTLWQLQRYMQDSRFSGRFSAIYLVHRSFLLRVKRPLAAVFQRSRARLQFR